MKDKIYLVPKNLYECFAVLDEIFNESLEDYEWFKTSIEDEVVCGLNNGLGEWMRNTWGLWSKETDLYEVFKNMGLWNAEDIYSLILTSYHRKINGKELNLKKQIQTNVNYWTEYEKINGPIEK